MNGYHQDGDLRKELGNLSGYVKSIQIRHLEIQQNHVRRIFFHTLKGFPASASLVADLPSALLLEQRPQIMPDRRVVVYHQNSNQGVLPFKIRMQSVTAVFTRPYDALSHQLVAGCFS